MFDKTLFDRNAFDRSVSSDGLSLTMLGGGEIAFRFTIRYPISIDLKSFGDLLPGIVIQQSIEEKLSGIGELNPTAIVLRNQVRASLSGVGDFMSNIVVRTPIAGSMEGSSRMEISDKMFFYQNMAGSVSGAGTFDVQPTIVTPMEGIFSGFGEINAQGAALHLPLTISSGGSGDMVLRRIGALNENVIELIGIDFKPGDTITIDTDLLQVLFGAIEDVSTITTDSVFFELNSGENEIVIDIDSKSKMGVTAVWQNRWL